MCCCWALVSDTLLTDTRGVPGLVSVLRVQPARERTVTAAAATVMARLLAMRLLSMVIRRQISALPPPTAQRLKQRRRIGKAIRPGLYQVYAALLIRLLGAQQRQIAGVAGLPLSSRQIQRDSGGGRRGRCGLHRLSVLFERGQGIGDILKGGQNGASILFRRLGIESLRGALLMQQRAALKNGGGGGRAEAPEAGARREQLTHGGGRAAGFRRQHDIRQSIRDRNADLG